jgi:hypothetical protein
VFCIERRNGLSDTQKKRSCLPVFLGWIAGIITGIVLIIFLIVSLVLSLGNQGVVVKNNS